MSSQDESVTRLPKVRRKNRKSTMRDDSTLIPVCEKILNQKVNSAWLAGTGTRLRVVGSKTMQNENRWQRWIRLFKAFVAYKHAFGTARIARSFPENEELGQWVHANREMAKKQHGEGGISDVKRQILNKAGFIWRVQADDPLLGHAQALVAFKDKHGHFMVHKIYSYDHALAKFMYRARKDKNNNQLRADIESLLNAAGFNWNIRMEKWETWFALLEDHKAKSGSAFISTSIVSAKKHPLKKLAIWIAGQRAKSKRGELSSEQFERLKEIGAFETSLTIALSGGKTPQVARSVPVVAKTNSTPAIGNLPEIKPFEEWQQRVVQVVSFKAVYGRLPFSPNDEYESVSDLEPILAQWVETNRVAYKKQSLTIEQRSMLECAGVVVKASVFKLQNTDKLATSSVVQLKKTASVGRGVNH